MTSTPSEKGFVLPIAIGVGLIAILLGIMVVARSGQNRITATAQRETARSLAAAETGITQFQSLFDRYRPLSTFCSTTATCATPTTWQTASNSNLAPNGACEADPASRVQSYANQDWQNVSGNAADGQFRLISYSFTPVPSPPPSPPPPSAQLGTGNLIVDGRVNANADGSNSDRTSTTRINVQFKVNDGRSSAGILPGLWVQDDAASSTDAATLNTTIRNSACLSVTTNKFASVPAASYRYDAAPGESFPSLPQKGMSSADFGTPTYNPSVITTTSSLPITSGTNPLTYIVQKDASDLSINLTANSVLTVGDPAQPATYILYLEGGINVDAGSQIKLASGSNLIVYAHGPITLADSAGSPAMQSILQEGTPAPDRVQVYVYPTGASGPTVNLIGGSGTAINLFLFAPKSQVTMSSGANVAGMIWAQSWVGSGGAQILQTSIPALGLNGVTFPPRISPITSWQRQNVS